MYPQKSRPLIVYANAAQHLRAMEILAWYGEDKIEKIVPGNEIFIEVHFKDGRVELFYCGMYNVEKDENKDREKILTAYWEHIRKADEELIEKDLEEEVELEVEQEFENKSSSTKRRRR